LVNVLVPVFLAAGGLVGWDLGRPHGLVPGLLGCAAGVVWAVPALGAALAAVTGVLVLWERAVRHPK
jgi:hypothetical protein